MCLNHSRSCKRCHNILKEWQLVYEHDRMKCWWIRCADCAIHYLYCVTEGMKDRGNNFILIWCVLVKMIFFLNIIIPPPSIWEPLHLIEYPTCIHVFYCGWYFAQTWVKRFKIRERRNVQCSGFTAILFIQCWNFP